jgi:predicted AAA+ superfamily ATPase
MAKSYRERVEHLLELIRHPLADYGVQRLKARYGEDWRQGALDHLGDRHHGHSGDDPREWDIQAWLNFYIGAWGALFSDILGPGERNYFFRLKNTRNDWAHQGNFDFDAVYRAHDDAQLALEAINSPVAEKVAELKEQIQREKYTQPSKKRIVRIKANPQSTLKPWRQVIQPLRDVQKGTFSSSEFAADLWEVYKATAGLPGARVVPEYSDPKTFFGRTFITEGLGNLVRTTAQRLVGSGGEPVVQLQTNFGGGKTHSMLAVYHMTGETPARDLPGLDAFLTEHGLTVPQGIRRAVVVGNKMPLSIERKVDGTEVRTLWGEIAWQLGGKVGYEMVREADEQATNPGDRITDVLKRFSPAVILIDEWVAYARQLYDRSDLAAGGSFDTQFTFAQTLTEAAKIAGGVVIVVSLPESDTEVGGTAGQETLKRLKQVVGRVESTWQPASKDEAYEIVRRRLFDSSSIDTKARSETVRAFRELYKNSPDHFPPAVRETEYFDRLENTYPIHPELFDALYRTWALIPGFQRTRGVLRLMATIIHSLWENGDSSPIIIPGMVPLDDSTVRSEFTKFLGTGWGNIIDAEVDGQTSIAAQIDRENGALGALGAGRRVARSLFLETSPTGGGNNPGVDERAVKVACALPGEKPAVFGDAIGYLQSQSVHLYNESGRYWYSEQPTLRKLAEDRQAQILDDHDRIHQEIETLLREPEFSRRGDFAAVHIAPRTTSDVSDEERVALVVLPPAFAHVRGDGESAAMEHARTILESRGEKPRTNKNMIVFAAADASRLNELIPTVALWLAWAGIAKEIAERASAMTGVTQGQEESARTELRMARDRVYALIPETYRWMLLPTQEKPGTAIRIDEHAVTGSDSIAERCGKLLRKRQWLMPVMDGMALRLELDQTPLWNGDDIDVGVLCQYFARHLYLPRIGSRETVFEAIRNGVADLAWNPQTFAWAARRIETPAGITYEGIVAGQQLLGEDVSSGFLVKPDVAARIIESARKPTPDPPPTRDDGPTPLPDGGDGGGDTGPDRPPEPPVGPAPGPDVYRRYFGTVELDPHRASTQMGTILEEVIGHLNATGATVRLSLEITADHTHGFPERERRIVEKNTVDLKFSQSSFEEE